MANSVMEKIMEQRNKLGLPAKSIQWGAVGEVGIVADMHEESNIDMEIGGTLQQRISSCLEELDNLMLTEEPLVSSMVVAEKKIVGGSKGNILDTIIAIMGIRDMKSISLDTTLSELGMDSLMAVELKQLLERDFDISLSMQELRALNFRKIIEYSKVKPGQDIQKTEADKEDESNKVFVDILRHFGNIVISEKIVQRTNFQHKSKRLAIIIPGMQGNASKYMLELCDKLQISFCLIQYNKIEACYAQSIDEIVKTIKPVG
jgi:fatty acid synthase